mmetsp:Transcript_48709/g.72315  ORF Transcript_48709/g.72315 Transcript_48709/m.72315 type:complete len:245 (+) Transcript_48709:397-1131(+)
MILLTIHILLSPRTRHKIIKGPASLLNPRYRHGTMCRLLPLLDSLQLDVHLLPKLLIIQRRILPLLRVTLGSQSNPIQQKLPLNPQHFGYSRIVNAGMDVALHDSPPIIILNQSMKPPLRHANRLGKPLLLEIPNRVIIRVGDEVLDALGDGVTFHQIHELGTVSLHLLTGAHGTERNLGKSHLGVGTVAYPADDFLVSTLAAGVVREEGEGFVSSVEHESCDVFLGHFGELFGEEGLQADESY